MTPRRFKHTMINYVTGFVVSLLLTVSAYVFVVLHNFMGVVAMVVIGILALAQFVIQLIFFVHVGDEAKPRYKLATFGMTILVILIIVVGSIWIMYHLNYNMMNMTPAQKDAYMQQQDAGGF